MGPDQLFKIIQDHWTVVMTVPAAFVAALFLGCIFGWFAAWVILKQRLDHYKERVDHFKDILAARGPNELPGGLKERANLRLHVYGDTRLPDRLSADNIWRWFYMHEVLVMLNQDGTKKSEILTSKLFISFDQDLSVGTLTIRSDKPLAQCEVKEFNNRFAIIQFGEAPIESNIEIDVRP